MVVVAVVVVVATTKIENKMAKFKTTKHSWWRMFSKINSKERVSVCNIQTYVCVVIIVPIVYVFSILSLCMYECMYAYI